MEKKYLGIIAIIIVIAAVLIIIFDRPNKPSDIVACTDDAKVCPDGTTVGRTGPNCEFAQCPDVKTPTTPTPAVQSFGEEFELAKGQTATFSDGLRVQLKSIQDSRCPADVTCIWQGEVAGTFVVSGANLTKSQEVTISTSTKPETSVSPYQFVFVGGTESRIRLMVENAKSVATGGCYIGGCSAQICSDQKDVVSTCEYREAYACYKTATCERQSNGQCGWTQTPGLAACLQGAR